MKEQIIKTIDWCKKLMEDSKTYSEAFHYETQINKLEFALKVIQELEKENPNLNKLVTHFD